jgi:hypothetical protein
MRCHITSMRNWQHGLEMTTCPYLAYSQPPRKKLLGLEPLLVCILGCIGFVLLDVSSNLEMLMRERRAGKLEARQEREIRANRFWQRASGSSEDINFFDTTSLNNQPTSFCSGLDDKYYSLGFAISPFALLLDITNEAFDFRPASCRQPS